jgi:hypothetical protein
VILLFAATVTKVPQQADALSRYDPRADDTGPATIANEKTDQGLQQDDTGNTVKPIPTTTPTLPTIPTVGCAMDTIENHQSFLSCLGVK